MYIERGIGPQSGIIPDRTSLSKPYLVYGHIAFSSDGQLEEHFDKYGRDFDAISPTQFLQIAQDLRDRPKDGDILEGRRFDGVICRYDKETGAFIAFNKNRVIRTFFKPRDGEAYFRMQMALKHAPKPPKKKQAAQPAPEVDETVEFE